MIEKLDEIDIETFPMGDAGAQILTILAHINGAKRKINELVDIANVLIKESNIHERQIDELQMKAEPKIELDRTRKALGIAVDALKKIKEECYDTTDVLLYANKALEQITALEQKDK